MFLFKKPTLLAFSFLLLLNACGGGGGDDGEGTDTDDNAGSVKLTGTLTLAEGAEPTTEFPAKVYAIGQEDSGVLTDDNGNYSLLVDVSLSGLVTDEPTTSTKPSRTLAAKVGGTETYHLVFIGASATFGRKTEIDLTDGTEISGPSPELTPTGTITGTVDLDGQDDNANVDAFIPGTSFVTKTDVAGNYTLANIPEGNWPFVRVDSSVSDFVDFKLFESVVVLSGETTLLPPAVFFGTAVGPPQLSNLQLNIGSADFIFNPETTDYTFTVGGEYGSIEITPTLQSSSDTISINTQGVSSGSTTTIALATGANTIIVSVLASDNATQTNYTLNITKEPTLSTNADLSDIALNAGTLSPTFDAGTTSYSGGFVFNSVSSLDIQADLQDSNATLEVDGISTSSGANNTVSLSEGINIIPVLVTAEDGVTTKTYTIEIEREVFIPPCGIPGWPPC